jgi:hypothetical protein
MRTSLAAAVLLTASCGGQGVGGAPAPEALPLPVMTLVGHKVAVFPVTLVAVGPSLGLGEEELGDREARLRRADSLVATTLLDLVPEVDWVLPEALRAAARRSPGMIGDPDRMGTAVLRNAQLETVPFPLVSEMRNLVGIVGERYALVPAAVGFEPDSVAAVRARVSVVLPDLRGGAIRWRSVVTGTGSDPWEALAEALAALAVPFE